MKGLGYEWTDLGCLGGKKRHVERTRQRLVMCVCECEMERESVIEADESWCGASESRRDGGSQQQWCL